MRVHAAYALLAFILLAFGLEEIRKLNLLKWQLEEQKAISHRLAERAGTCNCTWAHSTITCEGAK